MLAVKSDPSSCIFHAFQLFISYTELLETKERRRSHLTRVYSFQCSCERCHGEDEVASGLLAAAQEDIPATQLSKTIEEGLLKLDEDIHSKKKAQGQTGYQRLIDSSLVSWPSHGCFFHVAYKEKINTGKYGMAQVVFMHELLLTSFERWLMIILF